MENRIPQAGLLSCQPLSPGHDYARSPNSLGSFGFETPCDDVRPPGYVTSPNSVVSNRFRPTVDPQVKPYYVQEMRGNSYEREDYCDENIQTKFILQNPPPPKQRKRPTSSHDSQSPISSDGSSRRSTSPLKTNTAIGQSALSPSEGEISPRKAGSKRDSSQLQQTRGEFFYESISSPKKVKSVHKSSNTVNISPAYSPFISPGLNKDGMDSPTSQQLSGSGARRQLSYPTHRPTKFDVQANSAHDNNTLPSDPQTLPRNSIRQPDVQSIPSPSRSRDFKPDDIQTAKPSFKTQKAATNHTMIKRSNSRNSEPDFFLFPDPPGPDEVDGIESMETDDDNPFCNFGNVSHSHFNTGSRFENLNPSQTQFGLQRHGNPGLPCNLSQTRENQWISSSHGFQHQGGDSMTGAYQEQMFGGRGGPNVQPSQLPRGFTSSQSEGSRMFMSNSRLDDHDSGGFRGYQRQDNMRASSNERFQPSRARDRNIVVDQIEVLDNSEPDDVSHIFGDVNREENLSQRFNFGSGNMSFGNNHGSRSARNDDYGTYPVSTQADRNVCVISVADLMSSNRGRGGMNGFPESDDDGDEEYKDYFSNTGKRPVHQQNRYMDRNWDEHDSSKPSTTANMNLKSMMAIPETRSIPQSPRLRREDIQNIQQNVSVNNNEAPLSCRQSHLTNSSPKIIDHNDFQMPYMRCRQREEVPNYDRKQHMPTMENQSRHYQSQRFTSDKESCNSNTKKLNNGTYENSFNYTHATQYPNHGFNQIQHGDNEILSPKIIRAQPPISVVSVCRNGHNEEDDEDLADEVDGLGDKDEKKSDGKGEEKWNTGKNKKKSGKDDADIVSCFGYDDDDDEKKESPKLELPGAKQSKKSPQYSQYRDLPRPKPPNDSPRESCCHKAAHTRLKGASVPTVHGNKAQQQVHSRERGKQSEGMKLPQQEAQGPSCRQPQRQHRQCPEGTQVFDLPINKNPTQNTRSVSETELRQVGEFQVLQRTQAQQLQKQRQFPHNVMSVGTQLELTSPESTQSPDSLSFRNTLPRTSKEKRNTFVEQKSSMTSSNMRASDNISHSLETLSGRPKDWDRNSRNEPPSKWHVETGRPVHRSTSDKALDSWKTRTASGSFHPYAKRRTESEINSSPVSVTLPASRETVQSQLTTPERSRESRTKRRSSETSFENPVPQTLPRARSSPSKLENESKSSGGPPLFHRPWESPPRGGRKSSPLKANTPQSSYPAMVSVRHQTESKETTTQMEITKSLKQGMRRSDGDSGNFGIGFGYFDSLGASPELPGSSCYARRSQLPDENMNLQALSLPTAIRSSHLQQISASPPNYAYRLGIEGSEVQSKLPFEEAEDRQAQIGTFSFQQTMTGQILDAPSKEGQMTSYQHENTQQAFMTQSSSARKVMASEIPFEAEKGACARREDEVDIRIEVSDVMKETQELGQSLEEIYQSNDMSCECARIEKDILAVALDLYRGLEHQPPNTWHKKLYEANQVIKNSLELAKNCRLLCRHGRRVTDIFPGSVVIRIKCPTLISLVDLCDLHSSGDLHRILYDVLSCHVYMKETRLTMKVSLNKKNVQICRDYLVKKFEQKVISRRCTRQRSPKKMSPNKRVVKSEENLLSSSSVAVSPVVEIRNRSISTPSILNERSPMNSPSYTLSPNLPFTPTQPFRERKFSFGEYNRIAFQELNISDTDSPRSPHNILSSSFKEELLPVGGKYDVTSPRRLSSPNLWASHPQTSPLSSPRKLKTCDVIQEQENVSQDEN